MEKVNIIIGRFQPLTTGHMKCIDYAKDKTGYRTVLCIINTPDNKTDAKKPFPTSILMPIYKDLLKHYDNIADIRIITSANIIDIAKALPDYIIGSLTCGTDRIKDYTRITRDHGKTAGLPDDFECLEVKRFDDAVSATQVRQAISDNDYETFVKLVPYNAPKRVFDVLKDYL